MNSSVYIFGCLGKGYTQYPDDYANGIFQCFYSKATADSQVVVHRDNSLMYYGYVRKLDIGSQYIGFCTVLNGMMFSQIGKLFSIYENAIADLVSRGEILEFNKRGDITSRIESLDDKREEVERIASIIRNGLVEMESNAKKLPPVNYGISKNESKFFSLSDEVDDIIDASCQYGYTYILKDKDYNTASLSSYRSIIKRAYEEKEKLLRNYTELQKKYDILIKQKKQYKKVVFLCLVTILCGVGLFMLKGTLDSTKSNLEEAWNDITQKQDTIEKLDEKVQNLLQTLLSEQLGRKKAESDAQCLNVALDSTRKNLEYAKNEIDEQVNRVKSLNAQITNLQNTLSYEQSKRREAENQLSQLNKSRNYEENAPIIITNVGVANVYKDYSLETGYGGIILSKFSMFIRPKITYHAIKAGMKITLKIKLYTPSGLSRGTTSPSDCTSQESFYVRSGTNTVEFPGWGSSSKGTWKKGAYRYEFWYNNKCLKTHSFTIH